MIDDIYQLIQLYQLDKKDHPISFLNDNVPQWEERFPFPLDAAPAQDMLRDLAEAGINTRDDLADLAIDELIEITGVSTEEAEKVIMAARAHWFEEESK